MRSTQPGRRSRLASLFTLANNVVVNGNATITVNRNTANGSGNTIAFNSLTIGGQTLTLNAAGNTYHSRFNSVVLTSMPTLVAGTSATLNADSTDLHSNTTDNGAGIGIIKDGTELTLL